MQFRHKPIIITASPENGEYELTHTGNWILKHEDGNTETVTTEQLNKNYFIYFKHDFEYHDFLDKKLQLREFIDVYHFRTFPEIVKKLTNEELVKAKEFTKERIKNIDLEFKPMLDDYHKTSNELAHFGAYQLHDHEYNNYESGTAYLLEAKGLFNKLINDINAEIADRFK